MLLLLLFVTYSSGQYSLSQVYRNDACTGPVLAQKAFSRPNCSSTAFCTHGVISTCLASFPSPLSGASVTIYGPIGCNDIESQFSSSELGICISDTQAQTIGKYLDIFVPLGSSIQLVCTKDNLMVQMYYSSSTCAGIGSNVSLTHFTGNYRIDACGSFEHCHQPQVERVTSAVWVVAGRTSVSISQVAYSVDGNLWTSLSQTPFSIQGYGVAFGQSLWVATGAGTNAIAWSTNGISWTGVGTSLLTIGYGVAYSATQNRWVVCGKSDSYYPLVWSSDGKSWNATAYSSLDNFSVVYAVAFSASQNKWVALGNGMHSLAWSIDGTAWTGVTGRSIFDLSLLSVPGWASGLGLAFSPTQNLWVAAGAGPNTLAWSSDGITWNGLGLSMFNQIGYGVAFSLSQNLWVAVGSCSAATSSLQNTSIAWSTDGKFWTGILPWETTYNNYYSVSFSASQSLWIAGGCCWDSPFQYSSDGKNWGSSAWTSIATMAMTVRGVACNEPLVSSSTLPPTAPPTRTPTATPTTTRAPTTASPTFSTTTIPTASPTWTPTSSPTSTPLVRWVATGILPPLAIIWSSDGQIWNFASWSTNNLNNGHAVAYGQSKWVAVGDGSSSFAVSVDGASWALLSTPVFLDSCSGCVRGGYGVAFSASQNLWVAAGYGIDTLAWSPDGISWTGVTGKSIFSMRGWAVAFAEPQNLWVALGYGNNSIAWSSDGKAWVPVTNSSYFGNEHFLGNGVAFGLNRWVIVGYYRSGKDVTIGWSDDGKVWTPVVGSGNIFTVGIGGLAVAFSASQSRWVAVGWGNYTIAWSPNGVAWYAVAISASIFGNQVEKAGIAFNPQQNLWIAGGYQYNIFAYSNDGQNWTLGGSPLSGIEVRGVACNPSLPASSPTSLPTKSPTPFPTPQPPTAFASPVPTRVPTIVPTTAPTLTKSPTGTPTFYPTAGSPTNVPSASPTAAPTKQPTLSPTSSPSTLAPTFVPTTQKPTNTPTSAPTLAPITVSLTWINVKLVILMDAPIPCDIIISFVSALLHIPPASVNCLGSVKRISRLALVLPALPAQVLANDITFNPAGVFSSLPGSPHVLSLTVSDGGSQTSAVDTTLILLVVPIACVGLICVVVLTCLCLCYRIKKRLMPIEMQQVQSPPIVNPSYGISTIPISPRFTNAFEANAIPITDANGK